MKEVLLNLGLVSLEKEVNSGAKKVENLLNQIEKTKQSLSQLVAVAIGNKYFKVSNKEQEILVLKNDIKHLENMEKQISKLAK